MKIYNVELGDRSYPIIFQSNNLEKCGKQIATQCKSKTYIIITDQNVNAHYSKIVCKSIEACNANFQKYVIEPGEQSKSLGTVEKNYTWMLENRFSRDAVIIALGGGVVGDLAGFIAATYLRGIRFVQIPTTILAQVDSSVGGKVGINHPLAKNCIGAFYQPQMVLIDTITLQTLPNREIHAGLAEIVKYGFILDEQLLQTIETNIDDILSLKNSELLIDIIEQCCRLKAGVVEKDEKESNYRRILNFGHTIGHALESLTNYKYFRHGEAVAWGMLAAAAISHKKAYLSEEQFQTAKRIIQLIKKPPLPENFSSEKILELIQNDKKMTTDGLQFVLLEDFGKCKIEVVENELIRLGVEDMYRSHRS